MYSQYRQFGADILSKAQAPRGHPAGLIIICNILFPFSRGTIVKNTLLKTGRALQYLLIMMHFMLWPEAFIHQVRLYLVIINANTRSSCHHGLRQICKEPVCVTADHLATRAVFIGCNLQIIYVSNSLLTHIIFVLLYNLNTWWSHEMLGECPTTEFHCE